MESFEGSFKLLRIDRYSSRNCIKKAYQANVIGND